MSRRAFRILTLVSSLPLLAILAVARGAEAPPVPPPAFKPPSSSQKAEEYYKNIQVFKGTPANQLVPAMEFMAASLGVECDFCHVDHAPESDDKEEKATARKMIRMTSAINRDSFEGKLEVTCFSCHHGDDHPPSTPLVASADAPSQPQEPPQNAPRPTVDAVLEKYLLAVGGSVSLEKVESRILKGTVSGLTPEPLPLEIYAKSPDKRVSVIRTQRGEIISAFNGKAGWRSGGGGPTRDMTDAEQDAARVEAAFRLPSQVKRLFQEVRVVRSGKINGRDAVRIAGRNEGKPPVELWFDAETGLLSRMVRYEQTPLGRNPTQTDYTDYRATDGIKLPYQWSIARPGGRFLVRINEVRQNVEINDSKFEKAGGS